MARQITLDALFEMTDGLLDAVAGLARIVCDDAQKAELVEELKRVALLNNSTVAKQYAVMRIVEKIDKPSIGVPLP